MNFLKKHSKKPIDVSEIFVTENFTSEICYRKFHFKGNKLLLTKNPQGLEHSSVF